MSARKSNMSRETARKYWNARKDPKLLQKSHTWRTRPDPLTEIWPQVEKLLENDPKLQAKALFEHFLAKGEDNVEERHLRTFQRRVAVWKRKHGKGKDIFFPQEPVPGQLLQLDWTHMNSLQVTINGEGLRHLLCHSTLTYSNWEWAVRCYSESSLSLREGLQSALWQLGKVPHFVQIDNSSSATHQIKRTKSKRGFNQNFVNLIEHLGVKARTTNISCPNENGDIESQNGHLKNRIDQALRLRGSRDFESLEAYDAFVEKVLEKANLPRQKALEEELTHMHELPPCQAPEYEEQIVHVSRNSTIRAKKVAYSVPSRLIGHKVRVHVYETKVIIFEEREKVAEFDRKPGVGGVINWQHVISSLVRKPGAFQGYKYREQLFPGVLWRKTYERLCECKKDASKADREYLRLLKLALDEGQEKTEEALQEVLADKEAKISLETIREKIGCAPIDLPILEEPKVDLKEYDKLLEEEVRHVS